MISKYSPIFLLHIPRTPAYILYPIMAGGLLRETGRNYIYLQFLVIMRYIYLVYSLVSSEAALSDCCHFSFSHHRVTIPPSGWISSAHRQGVKILGTLYALST